MKLRTQIYPNVEITLYHLLVVKLDLQDSPAVIQRSTMKRWLSDHAKNVVTWFIEAKSNRPYCYPIQLDELLLFAKTTEITVPKRRWFLRLIDWLRGIKYRSFRVEFIEKESPSSFNLAA
jgi:hypothetical protein